MKKFQFVLTHTNATIFLEDGTAIQLSQEKDPTKFHSLRVELLQGVEDWDLIKEKIDRKVSFQHMHDQMVKIMFDMSLPQGHTFYIDAENETMSFVIDQTTYPLPNEVIKKFCEMADTNVGMVSLGRFISRLYTNPSKTAVDELFLFLRDNGFPIGIDGTFYALKKVRADFKDIYTGTLDYTPGQIVKEPRNTVCEDRNNTCSNGLHFCGESYLEYYGGGLDNTVIVLRVDPANVVSIPSDFDNAKGRACEVESVKEISSSEIEEFIRHKLATSGDIFEYVDIPSDKISASRSDEMFMADADGGFNYDEASEKWSYQPDEDEDDHRYDYDDDYEYPR